VAIKLIEITKLDNGSPTGNIVFKYDIVDPLGKLISSEVSTVSVNYNNVNIQDIAFCLIRDAESKEYEVKKSVEFDTTLLVAEIEKQISARAVIG